MLSLDIPGKPSSRAVRSLGGAESEEESSIISIAEVILSDPCDESFRLKMPSFIALSCCFSGYVAE
jgi:hypothetical protein